MVRRGCNCSQPFWAVIVTVLANEIAFAKEGSFRSGLFTRPDNFLKSAIRP